MIFVLTVFILSSVSFADATKAEVVLIDDIGSFSGAVLKVKSPISGNIGEKIFPVENLKNVGIVKFEIETALSEVLLKFIVTKDGEIIAELEEGPFLVNGSEILIDRREKIELPVIKSVVAEEPVVEVVNETVVENETIAEDKEEVVEEVVEETAVEDKKNVFDKLVLTGKAIFVKEDGSINVGFSITGMIVLLMFVSFVFMMSHRGRREAKSFSSEEDKELAEMENKVKVTEERLSKAKTAKEKKDKINAAKQKLIKEQKELAELEGKEAEEAEVIEDVK